MGFRKLVVMFALVSGACAQDRVDQLEIVLDANDSATAALTQWCERSRFADPAEVVARPVDAAVPAEPGDARRLLAISADEPLGYRHVELSCGPRVLSIARNWYVPALLTAPMNAALMQSHTPFGKIAAPLGYRRERLESVRGVADGCPADTVLTHRALLRLPDGRPLALLVECYQRAAVE